MAVPVIETTSSADGTTSPATSIDVPWPSGVAADDVVIFWVGSDGSETGVQWSTAESGVTEIDEQIGGSSPRCDMAVYKFDATGSKSGNVTFSHTASDEVYGFGIRISGADFTNVKVGTAKAGGSAETSHAFTEVSTASVDNLVIAMLAYDGGDATFSIDAGTGWATLAEEFAGTAANDASGCWTSKTVATVGGDAALTIGTSVGDGSWMLQIAVPPSDDAQTINLALADEFDNALDMNVAFDQSIAMVLADEFDNALDMNVAFDQAINLALSDEFDNALDMTASPGGVTVPLALADEFDNAFDMNVAFDQVISMALTDEFDNALDMTASPGGVTVPLALADEFDNAFDMTASIGTVVALAMPDEFDDAFAMTASPGGVTIALALPDEFDNALDMAVQATNTVPLGVISEVDTVFPITPSAGGGVAILLSLVREQDIALALTYALGILPRARLGPGTKIDILSGVTELKGKISAVTSGDLPRATVGKGTGSVPSSSGATEATQSSGITSTTGPDGQTEVD